MPSTWPVWVTDASLATVAMPKSATARRSRSSSRRLAGLTSRWTTSSACAASSAEAASRSQRSAVRRGIGPAAAQPVGDGAAGDVLHDHERPAVALADVEDGHDVRVVAEPRAGPRLAGEAAHRALVGRVGGGQHLDGDEPPEDLVLGGPDAGHAAVGDVADQAVALGQADLVLGGRHPRSR